MRKLAAIVLVLLPLSCGCDEVKSVQQWLVRMSTSTGMIIEAQSKFLSDAVKQLFYTFEIEGGVRYYEHAPLVGEYVEDYWVEIGKGHGSKYIQEKTWTNLKGARVTRENLWSRWKIDIDSLDEETRREYLGYSS